MNVYKGRLIKKSSNQKSKLVLLTLVTTWLSNITFHLLQIWLQTLVAIDSESRLTSFPSFCAPPSEVTVLFNSNLNRRPFLGQVVDSDLLPLIFPSVTPQNPLRCSHLPAWRQGAAPAHNGIPPQGPQQTYSQLLAPL